VGRTRTRRRNLIAFALLLLALALGTGLRVYALGQSPNVQHDEAWSYASAAGRLAPFHTAMDGGLTGRWVPAAEWQRLWESGSLGDLARVGPDLARYDVHPPLYFGVLHVWLEVAGMRVGAGRALNLMLSALTVVALFALARRLGFARLEASLAALVWAVSPAVVSVSSLTRQYDLLALSTVLLVWGLARAMSDDAETGDAPTAAAPWRTWPSVLWVAAATAAVLLTHYQAVILVFGGVVYVLAGCLVPGLRVRRRRCWPPFLGLAAGTAVAALLAPGWTDAFGRERTKLVEVSARVFVQKLDAIAETFGRFIAVPGLALVAAVAVVVVLFLVPGTRRVLVKRVRTARPGWWTILFFLAVTAGGVCLQNLLFLSMPPLVSARYLAMAWPFAAFLPLLFFGIWPRLRTALTTAFCLLLLAPATLAAPLAADTAARLPIGDLANADAVLIDNVGVGILPRFLWDVPADTPVFVSTQEGLLAAKEEWRDRDLGAEAYYVSILREGGLRWRRNRILANLRRSADVVLVGGNGLAEIYRISPREAPADPAP